MTKREMIFVSAAPDDLYFSWQYEIFIENVRRLGYTEEIRVLLFLPHNRIPFGWNPVWETLEERYKDQNVKFYRYEDNENLLRAITKIEYIPLLRPHVLKRHFNEHPELKEKAIFYHDSDIVFTKYLDFTPFLDDDICYLSDTKSYIDSDYWDRKIEDVKPEMVDTFREIDPLDTAAKLIGINREICEKNRDSSGGAQYLLKNIDSKFWEDVLFGCVKLRAYLYYNIGGINRRLFESENKGYQSWCVDMWAVLWNLWKRDQPTFIPPEMDFAHATDDIEKWDKLYLYHDAGANNNTPDLFFKRAQPYVDNERTPFEDDLSYVNNTKCSFLYKEEMEKIKQKYYT